jgi:hypothetical protein
MSREDDREVLWFAAGILALIVLSVFLGACRSAPEAIAGSAVEIRGAAESSRGRFEELAIPEGVAEQELIIAESEAIIRQVPRVQQVPTEWLGTIEWVAIAAVGVVLVVLIWQLGVGRLFRTAIGWLPRNTVANAKLMRESVSDPAHIREAVAALRAMDPMFDSAYRKTK